MKSFIVHLHPIIVFLSGCSKQASEDEYSIMICRSTYELVVNKNGETLKRYKIGICSSEKMPKEAVVIDKCDIKLPVIQFNPESKSQSQNELNVLYSRCITLSCPNKEDYPGFCISGTFNPDRIGKSINSRYIIMLNAEAKELSDIVPTSTKVIIVD